MFVDFLTICEHVLIEEASKQNLIRISQQAKSLRDKFKKTSDQTTKTQIKILLHNLRSDLSKETELTNSDELNLFITKAFENPLFQGLMLLHTKVIGETAPEPQKKVADLSMSALATA